MSTASGPNAESTARDGKPSFGLKSNQISTTRAFIEANEPDRVPRDLPPKKWSRIPESGGLDCVV